MARRFVSFSRFAVVLLVALAGALPADARRTNGFTFVSELTWTSAGRVLLASRGGGIQTLDPFTFSSETSLSNVLAIDLAHNPRGGRVYLSDARSDTTVVLAPDGTSETIPSIPALDFPVAISGVPAVDVAGNRIIAVEGLDLYVIDGADHSVDVFPLTQYPNSTHYFPPHVDRESGLVYLRPQGFNRVVVFDLDQQRVTIARDMGIIRNIAVDAALEQVYLSRLEPAGSQAVVICDLSLDGCNTVALPTQQGAAVEKLVVDPETHRVFLEAGEDLMVVDGLARSLERVIAPVSSGFRRVLIAALDTQRGALFTTDSFDPPTIARIDTQSLEVRRMPNTDIGVLALDQGTGFLYLSHASSGVIEEIDPGNRFPDPDFDLAQNTSGWVPLASSAVFYRPDLDWEGREATSNAFEMENHHRTADRTVGVQSPCFDVTGESEIELRAQIRLPTEAQNTGAEETPTRATGGLFAYASTNCSGSTLVTTGRSVPPVTQRGVWTQWRRLSRLDPAARSARFVVTLTKQEAGGRAIAEFDSLYVPQPPSSMLAATAAITVVGLARWRPREARVCGADRRSA